MDSYNGEEPFNLSSYKETLYFTLPDQMLPKESQGQNSFLIEVCDVPTSGLYPDLPGCLRVTDGVVVVLECLGGPVSPMDKMYLQAAMNEGNAVVVMINKMDQLFGETELIQMEEVYLNVKQTIDQVADITASMQLWTTCFNSESVVFGSGLNGWGFALSTFAQLYTTKFGIPLHKMLKKLWGEHYFDASTKKWINHHIGGNGEKLKRGFVQFILDPIQKLSSSIMKGEVEKYPKMLKSLGILLEKEEISVKGTELFHLVMRKFIPLSQHLLEMVVLQLPSPDKVQKHKANTLYTGPLDDDCANGIRSCKPGGPLMYFISQVLIPNPKTTYGIGRIFSGTLKKGETVNVLGDDCKMENIQPFVMIGDVAIPVQSVPPGIIAGLKSIGTKILNTATITNTLESHKLIDLRRAEPIISMSVCPKIYGQLPRLIEALKQLSRIENQVITYASPVGDYVLASYSEEQLRKSLKKLQEDICPGMELTSSEPFASYRETVTKESSQICLSKSPNKHNRLYCNAEPLGSDFLMDAEAGLLDLKLNKYGTFMNKDDLLITSKLFVSKYHWDVYDSRKIWCFGPAENRFSNVLVDQTRGIQFLNEIKDAICSAFQWATKEGVLCEEPVFGVRLNLKDATLMTDMIHRGSGQVIPTARRVFYASMYTASPAIMEPINLLQMTCPKSRLYGLLTLINEHHGYTIREDPIIGSDSCILSANVPVTHSYNLRSKACEYLGSNLNTIAEVLDHWKILGEVLQEGSYSHTLVKRVRERKGLKIMLPSLDCYLDKL